MRVIETQSKATIAGWCLDYAEEFILPIFEKECSQDTRPRSAIDASRRWFEGKAKLPEVKHIILNECHAAARELNDNPVAQAAARACGQAAACFHTPTHSLGLAFYGSAAIAYDRVGLNEKPEVYDEIAAEECAKMEQALRKVAIENEPNPAKINWNC
ncbi:MAG: putative immunity protein [Suipraeoptans sp.]